MIKHPAVYRASIGTAPLTIYTVGTAMSAIKVATVLLRTYIIFWWMCFCSRCLIV